MPGRLRNATRLWCRRTVAGGPVDSRHQPRLLQRDDGDPYAGDNDQGTPACWPEQEIQDVLIGEHRATEGGQQRPQDRCPARGVRRTKAVRAKAIRSAPVPSTIGARRRRMRRGVESAWSFMASYPERVPESDGRGPQRAE